MYHVWGFTTVERPDPKDLLTLVSAPSSHHIGYSNSCTPDLELCTLTKWLANHMLVLCLGRLFYTLKIQEKLPALQRKHQGLLNMGLNFVFHCGPFFPFWSRSVSGFRRFWVHWPCDHALHQPNIVTVATIWSAERIRYSVEIVFCIF